MKYLPKSRLKNVYSRKVAILVGLLFLGTLIFSLLDTVIISALSPIWQAENRVSQFLNRVGSNWHSKQTLIGENASLKEKLSSLELENLTLSLSLAQERSLLDLLGRTVEKGEIVAGVLTRPPQSPYDLILIDAGSKDLVTLGSQVSLPEGPVLGVVSEVFRSSSKVRLFSTAGEKVEAVLERGNLPVTLEGRGGGNFRIIVPRETLVEVGDRIITPQVNPNLLAVVEGIVLEQTDSFKEVLARSPANIFAIRLVLVKP